MTSATLYHYHLDGSPEEAELGPFPTFVPGFFRIAADDPTNTTTTVNQDFSTSDVILADSRTNHVRADSVG